MHCSEPATPVSVIILCRLSETRGEHKYGDPIYSLTERKCMVTTELSTQLQWITQYDYSAIERYLESPLPTEMDRTFSHLTELYRQADADSRCAASESLDENRSAWLNVFAYRMAMLAVRQQSLDLLTDVLTALLIVARRDERHNFLMTLSVAYHSAAKLGNPDMLFQDAAQYACDTESAKLLSGFLERAPQDKRIENMGFQEIMGLNGIIYLRANQEVPAGWK